MLDDPILTGPQRGQLTQLCRMLEARFHHEYHELLERLKDRTRHLIPTSILRRARHPRLKNARKWQIIFSIVSPTWSIEPTFSTSISSISPSADHASAFGINLDVDFDVFQRLEVFARGQGVVTRRLPRLWHRWSAKTIDIPVYQRLILLFRLRGHKRLEGTVDTNTIRHQVLQRHSEIRSRHAAAGHADKMSLYDHGKILLPTLSGVGLTIFKIVKGALLVAFAGIYGLLALLGLAGGTMVRRRSFFGVSEH